MKKLVLIFLFFTFIVACKKDKDETQETSTPVNITNDNFPLKTGNYWVYEFRTYYTNGTISLNATVDSLIVVGDTLLDGISYFMLSTNVPSSNFIWYLRDDNGSVLNRWNNMVLPNETSDDLYNHHYGTNDFGDTLYYYQDQFREILNVPSDFGDQLCMMQEALHIGYPLENFQPVVDTSYYSPIGPIQRSYGFISGSRRVGTLIDYHLE